jgi:hypothetical protein
MGQQDWNGALVMPEPFTEPDDAGSSIQHE